MFVGKVSLFIYVAEYGAVFYGACYTCSYQSNNAAELSKTSENIEKYCVYVFPTGLRRGNIFRLPSYVVLQVCTQYVISVRYVSRVTVDAMQYFWPNELQVMQYVQFFVERVSFSAYIMKCCVW